MAALFQRAITEGVTLQQHAFSGKCKLVLPLTKLAQRTNILFLEKMFLSLISFLYLCAAGMAAKQQIHISSKREPLSGGQQLSGELASPF